MKDCDPSTESSFHMYWNVNNLYGWAMSQKSVDVFKWRNDTFNFVEDFIQSYDENSDKGYIQGTKSMLSVLRNYKTHSLILPFLPERMDIGKCQKLVYNLPDRKNVTHIKP